MTVLRIAICLVTWALPAAVLAHTPGPGHDTLVTVSCVQAEIGVNTSTTCTVVVADIGAAPQRATPLGSVTFASSLAATFSPNPCTLAAIDGETASCSVTFTGTVVGDHTITATYPTTTAGEHRWAGGAPTTTVAVLARPVVAKTFSLPQQGINLPVALTITLTNPNASYAIVDVGFTDSYPGTLVNVSPTGAATTCGGTVSAASGGSSVQLSGGSIPAGGSCTVTVNVTSATEGSFTNDIPVGAVTSANAGSNTAVASAGVVFLLPLQVSKVFTPDTISVGGTSTLAITLTNPNAGHAVTSVAFTDTYPGGLVNSTAAATPQCSGTVIGAAGAGSLSLTGGTVAAGSSCSVSVSVTSATANSYNNSTGPVTTANAGTAVAAVATLMVGAVVGAFDAFETSYASWSSAVRIRTRISGAGFSLKVVALDTGRTAVQTSFSGTVSVALLGNTVLGVPLDAQLCPTSSTTIADAGYPVSATLASGEVTVGFPAVSNAWRDVRVRVTYTSGATTVAACSGDNFAIRPASFTLSATDDDPQTPGTTRPLDNVTVPGGNVHRAGQPFTIRASAVNAAGMPAVTTNYASTPDAVLAACGGSGCPATLGTLNIGAAFASGQLDSNAATYDETGAFSLLLRDTDFASVDAADSTNAERYIESAVLDVGRFVPDHFTVTTAGAAAPVLTNRSAAVPACAPASAFTYMGEPMALTFQLVARSATNDVTENYAGALATLNPAAPSSFRFGAVDGAVVPPRTAAITAITQANPGEVTAANHGFYDDARVFISGVAGMSTVNDQTYTITVIDANRFTIGVDTTGFAPYIAGGTASRLAVQSVSGAWAAGVGDFAATLRFERAGEPDGPFDVLGIGIAPMDPDGVTLNAAVLDLDADADGTPDRSLLATTEARFGRLRLTNAYGTATLDLTIPMEIQYYDGSFFVTSSADACTRLDSGNIALDGFSGALDACETSLSPTGAIAFTAGKGSVKLTAPGQSNAGSVDVTVNLGAAAGNTCNPGAMAATGADKAFLRGNWGSEPFDDDPVARATFGIYRNANEFIYFRENF
ncbi:MAG TPA: DUF6701 domain-containing protein [Burkholderiales bacterium]|nr:DUF6701 domain-containing protein [Burkholderiales bacterium]